LKNCGKKGAAGFGGKPAAIVLNIGGTFLTLLENQLFSVYGNPNK
jgi:hypothetical protein